MIVRKAKLAEVPLIVKLWQQFMKDHDATFLKKHPQHKKHIRRHKHAPQMFGEFVRKKIHSKNALVIVAEEKDLVGYGIIYMKKDPPVYVENTNAYISDLFVKKKYRGKKISSLITKQLISWAKQRGERNISLHVLAMNDHAMKIYKKWGFEDLIIDMRKRL
ncbi:GNAT family N-acetyltransferase [Candidatus Woesearchaeota archaeon]|nr:GNAT family N-acetyltransferase [Candidatus Woesearchaeota archaeon]